MNIRLDSSFSEEKEIAAGYGDLSGEALDYLWTSSWVTDGITPGSEKIDKDLARSIDALRFSCEKIFVVAGGCILSGIKGILRSCDSTDNIILLGDTLSPSVYGEILDSVENRSIGLIGISCKEEPVEQIAGFSIVREIIKRRCGTEEFAKKIVIITGKNADFFPKTASEGAAQLRLLPADIEEENALNTEAVIFPVAVSGANTENFLRGFKAVLTNTMWDLDGDRYSILLADITRTHGRAEDIIFWQNEFSETADWICGLHRKLGIDARAVYAPGQLDTIRQSAFQTHIFCNEENVDIMTPVFPGASIEGTLSQLVKEKQESFYRDSANKNKRFKISINRFDEENIGEMMAFFQISNGISRYISENS